VKKKVTRTKIDAKYVAPTKIEILESEKPKESMIELQNNLLNSLMHKPIKRQIEEIPQHEKMLLAGYYDARVRLQLKLEKTDRFKK